MKSKSLLLSVLLAGIVTFVLLNAASAVTRFWVGAGTNAFWSTPQNWSGNVVPASGDDLHFLGGQTGTINNLLGAVRSIRFGGNGSFSIAAGSLVVTNGISATNLVNVNVIAAPITLAANQSVSNFSAGTGLFLTALDLNSRGVTFGGAGTNQIGTLIDTGGGGGLTNIGGMLVLVGSNSFAGPTVLNSGTNIILGVHQRSPVTWTAGKLTGTGRLGRITASGASAKVLAPGFNDTGILTTSNLVLTSAVTVAIRLTGTNAGVDYDQIVVTNANVTLGSASLSLTTSGISNVLVGTEFKIIDVFASSNSVSGVFAGLPEGAEMTNGGLRLSISYVGGTDNDVTFTVVGVVPTGVQRAAFNSANQGDTLLFTAPINAPSFLTNPYPAGTSFNQLRMRDDPSGSGGVGSVTLRGGLIRLEGGIQTFNSQQNDIAKFAVDLPLALNRDQTFSNSLPWELRLADVDLNGHTLTLDGHNTDGVGIRGIVVTGLVSGATSSSAIIKQTPHPVTLQPLGGVGTYAGPTTINTGVLTTIGTFASTMIANPGATFEGTGIVGGIQSTGGVVAPANILQSSGPVILDSASRFHIGLPSTPNTNSDRLVATAGINLGNATLVLTNGSVVALQDTNYIIISKTSMGLVTGTFAGLAEGAEFQSSGRFYRISYAGGDGNDVIVISTNKPPIFTPVGNQTIIEQIPFTLDINATDPEFTTLTYSLDPGSPTNATIASGSGILSWTPTEEQGPGVYNVIARVTDDGNPPKSATMSFQVTVVESNFPPVISAPVTVTGNELATNTFVVSATDPDNPPSPMTYSLLQAPAGMTINSTSSASAVVTWIPTELQGPSTNVVLIRVAETVGGQSSTQAVTVIAREINVPPDFQPIAGTNVLPGTFIERALVASDSDVPSNSLTFQLISPPTGAVIVSNAFFQWTPASNQVGQVNISVRCRDTNSPAFNSTSLSVTQQFTVNVGLLRIVLNTNDSGTNSLRQAILDVNTNAGGGQIWFNIPGSGPRKIAPLTVLPLMVRPTIVDGYTQPGSHPNTKTNGTDAAILIEISGENNPGNVGLSWGSVPVTIRGLCINRFTNSTAVVSGCASCGNRPTAGSVVEGCFIGTDPTGTFALPNRNGIDYLQTFNSRIGGPDVAQRNLISGNIIDAINPTQGDDGHNVFNLLIQNNLVGCDWTGTNALGNGGKGIVAPTGGVGGHGFDAYGCVIADNVFVANGVAGVEFGGTSNTFVRNKIGIGADGVTLLGNHGPGFDLFGTGHLVGGTNAGNGNIIAGNTGAGVRVNGQVITVLGNSIFRNGDLAIDLISAANNSQSNPVLTSATPMAGGLTVSGTLTSASNTSYRLEFFHTDNFLPNNQPQAGRLIGTAPVTTDNAGSVNFAIPFAGNIGAGFVTATATDPAGNTSEISPGVSFAGSVPGVRLDVARNGGQVRVYWVNTLTNFTLQSNSQVQNSNGWANVIGSPGNDGQRFFRDFAPTNSPLFFRLKSP
jgi:hypothetical protein